MGCTLSTSKKYSSQVLIKSSPLHFTPSSLAQSAMLSLIKRILALALPCPFRYCTAKVQVVATVYAPKTKMKQFPRLIVGSKSTISMVSFQVFLQLLARMSLEPSIFILNGFDIPHV